MGNRLGGYAVWIVVAIVGAVCWGVLALSRGETVNAAWLLFAALASYAIAYRFYARFIQRRVLETDDTRATPAERLNNGRDFEPMDRRILFGHHFAAIAGAGPLVGPVLAAQLGFLPGTVWIIVGVIFAGAVQDMTTLFFSMRRNGKTLGQMAREEIGPVGGVAAIIAVLSIMVILIAVLALVVVNALAESPWGIFSLTMTLPIALLMGVYLRFVRPGRVLEVSLVGVVLLILAIIGGGWISESSPYAESWTFGAEAIAIAIIVYGFVASILPVWLLLAPRDYLSAFMKIGVIGLLAVGIAFTLPEIQMPRATEFAFSPQGGPIAPAGPLFPFVFITIACGALSGFHALVASGTTPKLIQKESQVRMIGYGAMLMESFVAVMALIAATTLDPGVYFAMNAAPGVVGDSVQSASQAVTGLGFSVSPETLQQTADAMGEESLIARTGGAPTLAVGMAQIFSSFIGGTALTAFWYHFAIMFEALFILTTVDAGTRVGRFMVQDMLGNVWRPFARTSWLPGNLIGSFVIVAAWGYFLYAGVTDPLGGINQLFPLFGIANQLLAAVALTVGTTILIKMGKLKYAWITALPLAWDAVVTLTASGYKIFSPEPRIGFFTQFADARASLASGEVSPVMEALGATSLEDVNQVWWNTLIDGSLSVLFAVLIIIVIADATRVWFGLIRGRKEPVMSEAPYEESHLDVNGEEVREPVGAGTGGGSDRDA